MKGFLGATFGLFAGVTLAAAQPTPLALPSANDLPVPKAKPITELPVPTLPSAEELLPPATSKPGPENVAPLSQL